MKKDIKSMLPSELVESFKSIGEKGYRAKQVFSWLHRNVKSFDEMTDLSLGLRDKLNEEFYISGLEVANKQVSSDGTIKYLWKSGESTFESVFMEYKHGFTICISTQVGCKMGCVFCASSIGGFIRNLTASEMLDQILFSQDDAKKRVSNVVLMGMGEPLDNFDNVIRFIELIREPKGLNIGARHITLSTCGLPAHIDRLAQYGVQLSLAISLHAPDDDTRSMLMPCNRNTGVKALIGAADSYNKTTGRRVTYEYALINDVNDTVEHAQMLVDLLKNTGSHLNLINLSKVSESEFLPSSKENVDRFSQILLDNRISFTTRRSLGSDIDAACGQLRRRNKINGLMGCD